MYRKNHKYPSQFGGADADQVWDKVLDNENFVNTLIKDNSLERLGIVKDQGKITADIDKVKKIFFDADPTRNKKYLKWILDGYMDGGNHMLEDVYSIMNETLTKFISVTDRKIVTGKAADMLGYCGLWGCHRKNKQIVGLLSVLDNIPESSSSKVAKIKGDVNKVYEDDKIIVINPKNEQEAIVYGQGTKWCTASKYHNMFNTYYEIGEMYVIIPKHPRYPNEKYQIHLKTGQFMDESNEDVKYTSIDDNILQFIKTSLLTCKKVIMSPNIQEINTHLIELISDAGLKCDFYGLYGFNILNSAQTEKDLKYWILLGINPNCQNNDGNGLLHLPIIPEHAELLLKYDANPDLMNNIKETPLFTCSDINVAEILLEYDADPLIIDKDENTILHINTNTKIIKLILNYTYKYKEFINARNKFGNTPLHSQMDPKIIDLLIKNGANVNAQNDRKETPIYRRTNPEILDLLIENGADVDAINNYGETPLDVLYKPQWLQMIDEFDKKDEFEFEFIKDEDYKTAINIIKYYGGTAHKYNMSKIQ
jgi:hypothetical protein